jgi:hypothetical protein
VSKQRANEGDRERALEGQVLDVSSFAPEKAGVLLTEDAISKNAQARSLSVIAQSEQLTAATRGFFHARPPTARVAMMGPVKPKPVIWKPRYASRRMRERAWAKADLQREQTARTARHRPSLLKRLLRR